VRSGERFLSLLPHFNPDRKSDKEDHHL
jgi:hypothetical protein